MIPDSYTCGAASVTAVEGDVVTLSMSVTYYGDTEPPVWFRHDGYAGELLTSRTVTDNGSSKTVE